MKCPNCGCKLKEIELESDISLVCLGCQKQLSLPSLDGYDFRYTNPSGSGIWERKPEKVLFI